MQHHVTFKLTAVKWLNEALLQFMKMYKPRKMN